MISDSEWSATTAPAPTTVLAAPEPAGVGAGALAAMRLGRRMRRLGGACLLRAFLAAPVRLSQLLDCSGVMTGIIQVSIKQ